MVHRSLLPSTAAPLSRSAAGSTHTGVSLQKALATLTKHLVENQDLNFEDYHRAETLVTSEILVPGLKTVNRLHLLCYVAHQ